MSYAVENNLVEQEEETAHLRHLSDEQFMTVVVRDLKGTQTEPLLWAASVAERWREG